MTIDEIWNADFQGSFVHLSMLFSHRNAIREFNVLFHARSLHYLLMTFLNNLLSGATAVLFLFGNNGLTVNINDGQKINRHFNFRIYLFFGITEKQWKKTPP